MRGLLQLFARFGGGLLFFLLESIALILVVQFNQNQNEIFLNSWGLFIANMEQKVDQVSDYYYLQTEVIALQRKNINLMQQLENAKYSNQLLRDTVNQDSLKQMYTYLESDVISNSVANVNNYIRINKGTNHGVEKHMGVIGDNGVAGIVRAVSPNFSSVMSILHAQSRIKAAVMGKGYFGTLVWQGKDSKIMELQAVPKHASIAIGDTIITSGYSEIFPEGIPIGTIQSYQLDPGENFFDITVELYIDMGSLRYVYIVENLYKNEHEQLDQAINE